MSSQFGEGFDCPNARHGITNMRIVTSTNRSLANLQTRLSALIAFSISQNRHRKSHFTHESRRALT